MALSFTRLWEEGAATVDGVTATSDVIRYIVPGEKKADVLAQVDLVALMSGGVHPDGLPLIPIAARPAERVGSGTDIGWYVDVEFGVNRLSGSDVRVPPPDTTDLGYTFQGTQTRIEEIVVPIVVETQVTFNQPLSGVPLTTVISRTIELRRVLPMLQYTVRVNLPSYTQSDALVVAGQTGKLHTFGGRTWRFDGADSSEFEKGVWTLFYTWTSDPGTPEIVAPEIVGTTNQMRTTPERMPFEDYIVVVYMEDSGPLAGQTRARVDTVAKYETDATGYTGLPGSPIA